MTFLNAGNWQAGAALGPGAAARPGGTGRRPERDWRARCATLAVCLGLAACSGGTGGTGAAGGAGGAGGGTPASAYGVLKVTVSDSFGAPVADAAVQGALGTSRVAGPTDAQGVALLPIDWPDGTADVTVSRASFVDKSIAAAIVRGQVNVVGVTLDRATSAAGGSLSTRSGAVPSVSAGAAQMSFEIELVVVGGDARPIENLTAADFVLRACTPDPGNDRADCVRGALADADVAYAPVSTTPATLTLIPGGVARPYAAALLLDQSGSIATSDPTGARLFSAKAFLGGLGGDDLALLAAFADGPGAVIPTRPLTVYPPFRDRGAAPTYFPTLDSLAPLMGGNTPLYASLDALRAQMVGDVSLPAGIAKAVVIFTDGTDTTCGSPEACRASRAQSILGANADPVRLFTIGLSSSVDIVALGELANQTGGAMLYADTAEQLLPLYGSVGRLLSLSLPTYRLRWTVQADAADAFQPGRTLLGRVRVSAGGSSFDVPFIVGVP